MYNHKMKAIHHETFLLFPQYKSMVNKSEAKMFWNFIDLSWARSKLVDFTATMGTKGGRDNTQSNYIEESLKALLVAHNQVLISTGATNLSQVCKEL